jgi:hypothetical protein
MIGSSLSAFPQRAIWLPTDGGTWTAARPADSMPPGPEVPMIWMQAGTPGELAVLMQAADARSVDFGQIPEHIEHRAAAESHGQIC